ncbi:MAG TPA: Sec-independent protein translocase protein TatB [Rhizomicrobium sp.]|jgi:sec-independent protein translocase protein TatB|nr:Sec-independent protein translocase protein TatB [Rhizomicrobium sp.]
MFDLFSWSHILILLTVALVVVGPKDLPKLMRTAGQWAGRARAMANEFRRSFDEMARQSELDELRKEIESLRNERPLAGIERDLNESILPPEHRSVPSAASDSMMRPQGPPEPPIDHSKVDEEPVIADPETAADVAKGPPAP